MTVNHGVPGSSPGGGAKPKVKPSAFCFIVMSRCVYILYSLSADKYYLGQTSDIENLMMEQNQTSVDSFTTRYRLWKLKKTLEGFNFGIFISFIFSFGI